MNRTKIGWCKNPDGTPGYTWNPITGCLNNCSYCYARKLANGRLRGRMLANTCLAHHLEDRATVDHGGHHADPFYPRYWPSRQEEGLGERPSGIFVCSMGDLFGRGVPDEWTAAILGKMRAVNYDEHRFYLLTKQPQNLAKWSPFPDNCWVGVSATDAMSAYDAMAELSKVTAAVKYISFEPLLEAINGGECEGERLGGLAEAGINWVIIGAQTKPLWLPEWSWVKEIIEAADKASIPVFLKDSLGLSRMNWEGSGPYYRREIGTWVLRQEMPKG